MLLFDRNHKKRAFNHIRRFVTIRSHNSGAKPDGPDGVASPLIGTRKEAKNLVSACLKIG
jgi:hypothetical protein